MALPPPEEETLGTAAQVIAVPNGVKCPQKSCGCAAWWILLQPRTDFPEESLNHDLRQPLPYPDENNTHSDSKKSGMDNCIKVPGENCTGLDWRLQLQPSKWV